MTKRGEWKNILLLLLVLQRSKLKNENLSPMQLMLVKEKSGVRYWCLCSWQLLVLAGRKCRSTMLVGILSILSKKLSVFIRLELWKLKLKGSTQQLFSTNTSRKDTGKEIILYVKVPIVPQWFMAIVACWNIRGLNFPIKQQEVRDFISLNSIDLLCLVETRVLEDNAGKIRTLYFPNWHCSFNYCSARLWRVWVGWILCCSMQDKFVSSQVLQCLIENRNDMRKFTVSFVYVLENCYGISLVLSFLHTLIGPGLFLEIPTTLETTQKRKMGIMQISFKLLK